MCVCNSFMRLRGETEKTRFDEVQKPSPGPVTKYVTWGKHSIALGLAFFSGKQEG